MSGRYATSNRELGQYPLSIATSLAIESICGIHPEPPMKGIPVRDYQELWINLRTLYRNLMGSIHKESIGSVSAEELAEALSFEMDQIRKIIGDASLNKTSVVVYLSDYNGLEGKYRHAVLRRDNTDKQKEYTAILEKTFTLLLRPENGESVLTFDLKLKPKTRSNALILTNYAYDLLSHKEFNGLALLESHTGKIKTSEQWYTKYQSGKDLPNIPFREDLLQIFGDSETFVPMNIKLRKDIMELATKYKWSSLTTRDKIAANVATLLNPFARDLIKDILMS